MLQNKTKQKQGKPKPRPKNNPKPVYRKPAQKAIIVQRTVPRTKISKPKREKKEKPWWETAAEIAGSFAGKFGPALIKGFGDYDIDTLQTNSVVAAATNGSAGSVPMVENTKHNNIVSHRDYIGDVYGSTNPFNLVTYPINPGLDDTFPWLSPQASSYTGYRMRGMLFEFYSNASEYSSTPYLGYVAMGTQYDSLEAVFPSKRDMLNSEFSNSGKPSENLLHPIECAKAENVLSQMYVRTSNQGASSSDLRFFDLGKFSIATGGQTSSGKIGELWCTYEIEFFKPKLASAIGSIVNTDGFDLMTVANATPLGTTTYQYSYPHNTLGGNVNTAGTSYLFPAHVSSGAYMVEMTWVGAAGVVITSPILSFANCSLFTGYPLEVPSTCPVNGVTSAVYIMSFIIQITGTNASFTLGAAGTIPFNLKAFMMVTQVPFFAVLDNVKTIEYEEEDPELTIEEMRILLKEYKKKNI